MLNTKEKTQAVVSALEDVKALDITVIDTSKLSPLFECMVVASAQSTRQTKALASSVVVKLKELGETVYSTEGEDSGEWVLVDLGEVVVHIMQPAVRAYYNLEELWSVQPKQRAHAPDTLLAQPAAGGRGRSTVAPAPEGSASPRRDRVGK
jgi:ribosome-associated protein